MSFVEFSSRFVAPVEYSCYTVAAGQVQREQSVLNLSDGPGRKIKNGVLVRGVGVVNMVNKFGHQAAAS